MLFAYNKIKLNKYQINVIKVNRVKSLWRDTTSYYQSLGSIRVRLSIDYVFTFIRYINIFCKIFLF
jgi:hypothetical protein